MTISPTESGRIFAPGVSLLRSLLRGMLFLCLQPPQPKHRNRSST
jgi:hypothetical protein